MAIHNTDSYNDGYRAAYEEIYRILNDETHQAECGECRACGVVKQAVEILMETLASKMTQDEFFALAMILNRAGNAGDTGNRLDWWGIMNDAIDGAGFSEGPIE